ncbi:MAG: FGGY family carbohydrate kinase, partial [Porticoccaceae bacterium]|nr:FGGY family carbohydrate kinase [Porticoccaceae bacterium]
MNNLILALDQGTTSSRSMLFNENFSLYGQSQKEFSQHFPYSGWVEHDPMDIWRTTLETSQEVIAKAGVASSDIAAIGITNQRETTLI